MPKAPVGESLQLIECPTRAQTNPNWCGKKGSGRECMREKEQGNASAGNKEYRGGPAARELKEHETVALSPCVIGLIVSGCRPLLWQAKLREKESKSIDHQY